MVTLNFKKSIKCNGELAMFVSFPYDYTVLSFIRGISTRYWHKELKEWEVPLSKYKYVRKHLEEQGYEIKLAGNTNCIQENVKRTIPTIDFNFKTKPFSHQIEGLVFGQNHDKWLLADEQGLGKSKEIIDCAIYKKQHEGIKHCLIICGVNGLKWNWQKEVEIHSDESSLILGQRTRKNGKIYIGSTADKLSDLKYLSDPLKSSVPFFLITNIETLRNTEIASEVAELCKKGIIEMVAADEIHACKNPSSQQGKGFLKIKAKYQIAMTGTPIMNSPLDLFIILKWLGIEKHSFYQFKNHYCLMGGYGGYEILGYKNLDDLQDSVQGIMLRRLKEDVLDLPDKIFIDEYVEMTGKQEQLYKEVANSIRANIDKIKLSNNPLAELIRMRQATGYTGILSSTIKESAKLDRLEELVNDVVANNRKAVIFSNWTQMTDPIWERLSKKYNGTMITGETKDADRLTYVNTFQTDSNCKFMVGTIGAMGTGLTLTAGTVVIFLDEPWTMANKQQAIDRCHRIGTKENITVYTILAKDTIDERIHNIVERKGAMSDYIVDNKITKNKEELLEYLIS